MKKIYVVLTVFLMSCVFGRISNNHAGSSSPYGLSFSGQKGELNQGLDTSDTDIRWKRRHKKRKKVRRPQRGR